MLVQRRVLIVDTSDFEWLMRICNLDIYYNMHVLLSRGVHVRTCVHIYA